MHACFIGAKGHKFLMGFEGVKLFSYGRYSISNKNTKQIAFDANQKKYCFLVNVFISFLVNILIPRDINQKGIPKLLLLLVNIFNP